MRNKTETKTTISMRHVDNNHLLTKFLEALRVKGQQGGDLIVTIECDSGNKEAFFLGHDVSFEVKNEYIHEQGEG